MRNNQQKVVLATLLVASGLSPALLAQAAESETNKPATELQADSTSAQNKDAEAKSTQTSKEKSTTSKDGVFIPSEEISEDFAVSFPVDI